MPGSAPAIAVAWGVSQHMRDGSFPIFPSPCNSTFLMDGWMDGWIDKVCLENENPNILGCVQRPCLQRNLRHRVHVAE